MCCHKWDVLILYRDADEWLASKASRSSLCFFEMLEDGDGDSETHELDVMLGCGENRRNDESTFDELVYMVGDDLEVTL